MKTVLANGISTNVYDEGEGTPILFVHGFPLDHRMWREQLDVLAADFRVIAPDLRGFGRTTVTEGVVTMETHADDLAALLDELGIGASRKIVLCGLSMGGYVAWQFQRKYGARLLCLILCDTRAIADSPEAVENRRKLAATVLEHGTEPVAAAMMPSLFAEASTEKRREAIELTRLSLIANSPAGIAAAALGIAERPDVTSDLPHIKTPALLIVGEDDRISTVEEMRGIAQALPNAELVVIPESGHMSPLENPEPVNQAILEFVSRSINADMNNLQKPEIVNGCIMSKSISTVIGDLSTKRIPSFSKARRVWYQIDSVQPGVEVVMVGGKRKQPSRLPWSEIEKVYQYALDHGTSGLDTLKVDDIVGTSNNWSSSTMLALVLTMMDPKRVEL